MTFTCIGFLFFMECQMPAPPAPANNFATECRIYDISKKDTAQTQKNISRENARCRAARAQKK